MIFCHDHTLPKSRTITQRKMRDVSSPPAPPQPRFIIITGFSGSGKGSALRAFEDLGYYCIDNLPIDLIPLFAELCATSGEEYHRAAMVVDVREGSALDRFPQIHRDLKSRGVDIQLLFLEADNATLARRYSETRRPHPLLARQAVTQSIALERKRLKPIRSLADTIIDTSALTVHDLRRDIMDRFAVQKGRRAVQINLISFGFRYGIPPTSDLVFDVRFLPNPNFVTSYKSRTGNDARVRRYVLSFQQTREFLTRLSELLRFLLPQYEAEGKSYLTIAVGCTGGRHRSVVLVNQLRKFFRSLHYRTTLQHRDVARGGI